MKKKQRSNDVALTSRGWVRPIPIFRWPLLVEGPSAFIKWACRGVAGLGLIHYVSPTFHIRGALNLDELQWQVLYLISVGSAVLLYLWLVEPFVLRAFRYIGPFDLFDLGALVVLPGVGSNLISFHLAQFEPIYALEKSHLWSAVYALWFGVLAGLSFQFLFRWLRNLLVSLPQPITWFDKVKAGLLVLSLVLGYVGDLHKQPILYLLGASFLGGGLGLAMGMTWDAGQIWQARLRTRAHLIVFPKQRESSTDKHSIELAMAQGRLGDALSLLKSSTELSAKDAHLMSMTYAYLTGDYKQLRKLIARPPDGALNVMLSQRALTIEANARFDQGDVEGAISMIADNPAAKSNPYAQLNLALFYSFIGALPKAVEAARLAYHGDPHCPAIATVFVCLCCEAAKPGARRANVDRWLRMIREASTRYKEKFGVDPHTGSARRYSPRWRSMLYLIMTEATLLLEKNDRQSLSQAAPLLRIAEGMEPSDPWVRAKIAAYFFAMSKRPNTNFVARLAYEFKGHWQQNAADRLSPESGKRVA